MRLRRTRPPHRPPVGPSQPAPAVFGTDLDGAAVELDLETGRTVLYFLTSSCRSCQPVWEALAAGAPGVAVTPDAATEDRRKLRKLAGGGIEVVLSSDAWFRYGAGPAPWRVVVEDGVVVEAGP
jgi:hypothetical protein